NQYRIIALHPLRLKFLSCVFAYDYVHYQMHSVRIISRAIKSVKKFYEFCFYKKVDAGAEKWLGLLSK
ncbi:MAG TPA: hypothetical protein VF700_12805, partial [Segetibacter sp.]